MTALLWLAVPIVVTAVTALLLARRGRDTYAEVSARQRTLQALERVHRAG